MNAQDKILEALNYGGDMEWGEVNEMFMGLSVNKIESKLNELFPTEDNADLASLIYNEVE